MEDLLEWIILNALYMHTGLPYESRVRGIWGQHMPDKSCFQGNVLRSERWIWECIDQKGIILLHFDGTPYCFPQFTLGNPSISAWLSCIILQGSLCGKVWCTLVFVQLLVWKWNTLYSFTREQNSSLEAKWDNGSFCCGQAHLATSASDKCHKLIWH